MRIILLGAPGAGKGTQGALLAETHDVERISTGDLLREAVRKGTPLGREARKYMDAGELVPDDVILGMVREVLDDEGDAGFILDGFPRTVDQADGLADILDDLDLELDAVVVIRVSDEELIKRLSGRRSCPECNAVYNVHFDPPEIEGVCDECGAELVQRSDDEPETVKNRIQVYNRQTRPLIDYYEASDVPVEYVDGEQDVDAVQDEIEDALADAE
ncbi:MAG: adenylate kinase [Candidatus Longimicrobiales bacterium M2_2A_002]